MTKFDASGATVKIHATADGSVRVALNAFEAARMANGDSGLQHQIAYAGYVHPDDRKRFAKLSVVVDACPTFWFPHVIVTAIEWAIGHDRAYEYWPFRDLIAQGAVVALGSDWPVLPSPDPLLGLEGMVTRRDPTTNGTETLWIEQAITLEEAVKAATINGAKALNIASQTGPIEIGKSADIVVFDPEKKTKTSLILGENRKPGRVTLTKETRSHGARTGFMLTSFDGRSTGVLAQVDIRRPHRMGRYGVDLAGFERFLGTLRLLDPPPQLVIIDEIGRMECLSERFRGLVTALLAAPAPFIATIALRGDGYIGEVKRRPDILLRSSP